MLDCLVIGAGQSGLTCGNLLKETDVRYQVIDSTCRVGDVWRNRPLNLRLFTSREFCKLADAPMPGDPHGFPSASEFADYIEQFAKTRQLNVRLNCRVVLLSWEDDAFSAMLSDGSTIRCATVINATGSNQQSIIPTFAQQFDPFVQQLVAGNYRDTCSVGEHSVVMVVGDGASGRQIAQELAATHRVILATGRKRKLTPNMVLGRDIFWWMSKVGLLYTNPDSLVAKILRKLDPIPAKEANNQRLAEAGVILKPRATGASGKRVMFSDGSSENIDAVIWCIGYKEDLSWIALPAISSGDNHIEHDRGITAQPGFYLLGRKWLTCRASELILGTERDARMVVEYVVDRLGRTSAVSGFRQRTK